MVKPKNQPPKITVESLLRLKRHEMPDETFWAGFDRKLEKRIVQSIVSDPSYRGGWFQPLQWARHPACIAALIAFALCAYAVTYFLPEGVASQEKATSMAHEAVLSSNATDTIPVAFALQEANMLLSEAAEKNFVIDVWSTNKTSVPQDQSFHLTHTEAQDAQAYYVADQLNSQGGGWSGERLPF
jgi:hypothetical protein